MKKEKIIIGSRNSKLAFIYAQNVKNKILDNTNLRHDQIIIKVDNARLPKLIDSTVFDLKKIKRTDDT